MTGVKSFPKNLRSSAQAVVAPGSEGCRVGNCRESISFLSSTVGSLRVTVNHHVAGSSPASGAIFTSRLGKGQAQKLWREFSSAPVWVEGRARSGTGQCRRCMEVLATISMARWCTRQAGQLGRRGGSIPLAPNSFKSYSSTLTVGLHTEGESATPVRLRQDRQIFMGS